MPSSLPSTPSLLTRSSPAFSARRRLKHRAAITVPIPMPSSMAAEEHQRETKRLVDEGRAFFEKEFRAMKLSFVPSAANFVLVKVGDGLAVFRALLQRKVIVRAMKGYNLPEWIRITIGTMDQNQKCITALRQVL